MKKAQYKENMASGPNKTDFNPMTANTKTGRKYGVEGGGGAPSASGPSGKFVGTGKTAMTYGTKGVGS